MTIETSTPSLEFYIFGDNIAHSLSPTLHNAAFQELGFPHHYSIHQSKEVDKSVEDHINEPNFGGASVTFPHKLQVGKLLDVVSPKAELIGAVNTIIVQHTKNGRVLVGENTDWSGIRACILQGGITIEERYPALVLGAGGAARAACYALQTLNVKTIALVNRTRKNAEAMAANFPDVKFEIFENLEQFCGNGERQTQIIVACIPADDLQEKDIPKTLFSGQTLSVLVEMAYRPVVTGIMKAASHNEKWKVFRGTDVLMEQAFAQFELWTGHGAPVEAMRNAMEVKLKGHL